MLQVDRRIGLLGTWAARRVIFSRARLEDSRLASGRHMQVLLAMQPSRLMPHVSATIVYTSIEVDGITSPWDERNIRVFCGTTGWRVGLSVGCCEEASRVIVRVPRIITPRQERSLYLPKGSESRQSGRRRRVRAKSQGPPSSRTTTTASGRNEPPPAYHPSQQIRR